MATTYLTLVNNVLNELNESELTSSSFSSSRGIQTSVKKFVLKATHEVYNSLSEVPDFNGALKLPPSLLSKCFLPFSFNPPLGFWYFLATINLSLFF